jgi:hypothetical protein
VLTLAVDLQLLWRGQQAFETALELIALAEDGVQQLSQQTGTAAEQFVWRQDILRPAADAKQVCTFSCRMYNNSQLSVIKTLLSTFHGFIHTTSMCHCSQ